MSGVCLDSAYLVKCYLSDPDSAKVRKLAVGAGTIFSSSLCLAEVACAVHRALREGSITPNQASEVRRAFSMHIREGAVALIPVSDRILHSVEDFIATMPAGLFLRSGDALHLASARHEGFPEIWTNDRHMLQAAQHFGVLGRSV